MIQLIVNVNLLREIDERRLINTYARLQYYDESDVTDDIKIRNNLEAILNWDVYGDRGLKIYCSKFETLKEKDWKFLVDFIKKNKAEIIKISYRTIKQKRAENKKIIDDFLESRERKQVERFTNEEYTVSGRGKKARPCVYEGREYKSRQECIYKEGISKYQLYEYLKNTGQL